MREFPYDGAPCPICNTGTVRAIANGAYKCCRNQCGNEFYAPKVFPEPQRDIEARERDRKYNNLRAGRRRFADTLPEANRAPMFDGWGCPLAVLVAVVVVVFIAIPAYRLFFG